MIWMSEAIFSCHYKCLFLGIVQVKTVEGLTDLQIPSGTQPGDVLVLARKGAPKLNRPSIRGDHLFTVKVSIPKRIRYTITAIVKAVHTFPFISLTSPARSEFEATG